MHGDERRGIPLVYGNDKFVASQVGTRTPEQDQQAMHFLTLRYVQKLLVVASQHSYPGKPM